MIFNSKEICTNEAGYSAFPTVGDIFHSAHEAKLYYPIGMLNTASFGAEIEHNVPLFMPLGIEPMAYGCCEYGFVDGKWQDLTNIDGVDDAQVLSQLSLLNKAKASFATNGFLPYGEADEITQETLFNLGGDVPVGQNWDACLENEIVADSEEEEDQLWEDLASQKKPVFVDDESGHPYFFLGLINCRNYCEDGGEILYFYEPNAKKIMLAYEFS